VITQFYGLEIVKQGLTRSIKGVESTCSTFGFVRLRVVVVLHNRVSEMAATREQKREVMTYLLKLLGLDEDKVNSIVMTLGIDNVLDFVSLEPEEFETDDWKGTGIGLTLGDRKSLARLASTLRYFRCQTVAGTYLPTDINIWKTEFTSDIYEDYKAKMDASNSPEEKTHDTMNASTESYHKDGYISVKMSDYPEFKGKMEAWPTYKKEHEATAEVHGIDNVALSSKLVVVQTQLLL